MADNVDFTKLIASIDRLEKAMSKSSGTASGSPGITDAFSDAKEASEQVERYAQAVERANNADKKQLESKQKILNASRAQAEALREEIRLTEKAKMPANSVSVDKLATLESEIETLEGATEAQGRFNGLIQSSLGLGRKNIVSLLAQKGGLQGVADSLRENITLQGMSNALLSKFIEGSVAAAFALSGMRSEFLRTTGASEELTDRLGDFDTLNLAIGVGMREMNESLTAVRQGLSGVHTLSTEAQIGLGEFAAANERLGVESATTVRNLDSLTKVFGQTLEAAQATSDEMLRFGYSIGLSAEQVSGDFAEATPFIAQFGDRALDVFQDLEIQAQATGIAIGTMTSAIEGLDTIQGTQEAVQGLNAALGTSLNAFEIFQAVGVDKLRLLQEGFQATGHSFSDFDRHMQQHVASQFGMSVAETARLLGGSAADQRQALEGLSQAEVDLNRRREASLSVQEKLAKAAEAFTAFAQPVLVVLEGLASLVLHLTSAFDGWGATLLWSAIALRRLWVLTAAYRAGTILATIATGADTAAKGLNKLATDAQNQSLRQAGPAANAAAPGVIALGFATLLLGAGIGIAALGMAQFVSAFQGMSAGQILAVSAAVIVFAAAVVAFAFAATLAAKAGIPGLIFIGLLSLAFLALAAGVMMMAEGLTQMSGMSSSLISLAAAAPGLMAVAASIAAISYALWTLPNEEMINFAGAMEAYASAVEVSAQSPAAVNEIKQTIDAAAQIESSAGLASLFVGMAAMATAIGGLGQRPIQIRINERVFGDSVVSVFNDRLAAGFEGG